MLKIVCAAESEGENGVREMADEIVRCPYCVLGDHFHPMLEKLEGWFICTKCGHAANPGMINYRCHCKKCQEMNRAA